MSFFPVLYIIFVFTVICKGQHEKTCTVSPKDENIKINSSITIECWSSCSPGRIYWTLNNSRIDDVLSKTINSTYTILSLKKFSHYSATIQCHSALTGNILGGTTITTYTRPNNISCILQYKDKDGGMPDLFTCGWEHIMTTSMKVNYTVIIGSRECASCSQSEDCMSKTTCNISSIPNMSGNIFVTVRAQTVAWEVVSEPYEVDPFHILQIAPPKINVTALSNHLTVEWNRPDGFEEDSIHCQVKLLKSSEPFSGRNPERVLNVSLNPMVQRGKVAIEEVESCTNYTVSARCALDEALWSKWSQGKTVLSQLNNGTVKFNLWRKMAKPNNAGVRTVLVMWTTISPSCKGDFDYNIGQIRDNDYTHHTKHTSLKFNRANSTCHVNVDEEAHRIKLTVRHNRNRLGEEAVYIPAIGENVPQVSYIQTSVNDGDIEVRWKAPDQPVSGYMIDWTYDGLKYFWKEIKDTNTTLTELQDLTKYNITVTPLFDDKTGHGEQALQICSREGAPDAIFIDDVQAEDRSARVRWRAAESQKQCCGVVVKYTVLYSDSLSQLNVTVDSDKKEAFLTDLKPDTKYSVRVMAIALTGNSSSFDRHFKTKRFDPNLILLLSVCGGIAIFLVLFLGLCCAIQWKKFMEKMVPNPGLSSLALWSSQNYQMVNSFIPNNMKESQAKIGIHPFTNPSESPTICEMVYPCELYPSTSGSPPLVTGNGDTPDTEPAGDPTQWLSSGFSETNASESEPADEVTESGLDPANTPYAPGGSQEERPAEPMEPASSPEETSEPRAPDGHVHPYRSQTSVEPPAPVCPAKQGAETSLGASEECKHMQAQKQQGKTAPLTAYITVDVFEQGQGRLREG